MILLPQDKEWTTVASQMPYNIRIQKTFVKTESYRNNVNTVHHRDNYKYQPL